MALGCRLALGTIRYGSNEKFRQQGGYFMEEVRRTLLKNYGEKSEDGPNSLYAGGLWVRTSMNPVMQDAAANALREGLARFDGGRGWRDIGLSVDLDSDWAGALDRTPVGTGFPDWRKAVVLAKDGDSGADRLHQRSTGTLPRSAHRCPSAAVGGTAFDNLRPGMVIIVKQDRREHLCAALDPGDRRRLRLPKKCGRAACSRCRAGSTWSVPATIAPLRRFASPARRSSRSSTKPLSRTALRPRLDHRRCAFLRVAGRRPPAQMLRQLRQALGWSEDDALGRRAVAQPDDRSRRQSRSGCTKITDNARKLGVGDYPELSVDLARRWRNDRSPAGQCLCDARQPGPGGEADADRLCPGPQRQGHLSHRQPLPRDGQLQRRDWDGKAMPRPPSRDRQLLDPMAAFQMVHIMEGVVERGTATVLRDLDRPMFGKTGTTSGPTNVWFVGGTPDVVGGVYLGYDQPRSMGGYAQGGRIAAPIFKRFGRRRR